MRTAATLLLLVLLAAGCDSRDFAGPVDEAPAGPPPATTFDVNYRVEGTYYSCRITYLDARRQTVSTSDAVRLPWTRSFKVDAGGGDGAFDAFVSATCADPNRLGKSTVAVLVDGAVKDRANGVGFGATATAAHTLGAP